MKRILLSALALALVWAPASRAWAQATQAEMKPLVVASFAGYGELQSDVEFLGRVSNNPQLAAMLEAPLMQMTQGKGLAGLDQEKPWGVVYRTDGLNYQGLGFLPVTDFKALLGVLAFAGQPTDVGDGVLRLDRQPGSAPAFVKEQGGWAFISQTKEALTDLPLPEDPTALLGDLVDEYDVAVRAYINNIPEALRGLATTFIRQGAMASSQQRLPNESEEGFALRTQMLKAQLDNIEQALNELDALTLGFTIDAEGERALLDMVVTFVEGSESARQIAEMPKFDPQFAGFLLPDSVARLHMHFAMGEADVQQAMAMFAALRQQILEEIENEPELADEDAKEVVKGLVDDALDVAEATLEQGRFELGLAMVGEGPFTLAAGALIADGDKLEEVVKKLVDLAAEDPNVPEIKLDVGQYQGVRFHTLAMPVEGDEEAEPVRKLFGDPVSVTVGFGPESVFVAVGQQGIDTIKQVIDKSEATTETDLPLMQFSLALAPIMEFASQQEDAEPNVAMLAQALAQNGGDHVNMVTTLIPNGERIRFELEKGILKLIGAASQAAAGAGAGF